MDVTLPADLRKQVEQELARSLSEIDFVQCRINNLQTFGRRKIPVSY
jgi:hypothetical protein